MPLTLIPNVSAKPYAPNVAWNNSWIIIDNDQNRPLFAQATYVVNNNATNDLLTELINEIRQKENDNGFDFIDDTNLHEGNYQTLKVVADTKIAALTADNSSVGNLSAYELPEGFELNGQIYAFQLQYGAVLAYKIIELDRYENSIVGLNGKSLVTIQDGEGVVTILSQ